jgi:hypothetical protein
MASGSRTRTQNHYATVAIGVDPTLECSLDIPEILLDFDCLLTSGFSQIELALAEGDRASKPTLNLNPSFTHLGTPTSKLLSEFPRR